jgi:acyl-CoA thioester hydrolase
VPTIWRAPVRYAEVDGQGVVFNSHYLLYCDEAMSLFCRERGLADLAERVQLKVSNLTWTAGARWGETLAVTAVCSRVGRTSFQVLFDVRSDERPCCEVQTTYVLIGADGTSTAISDEERALLAG